MLIRKKRNPRDKRDPLVQEKKDMLVRNKLDMLLRERLLRERAVRKIGPLRKAELFGSLPLCGRPSYQSASFLLMEYNNARAPALLAFFTGARRMYHSSRSFGKESSVCYNLYGNESHMLVENCSGIH